MQKSTSSHTTRLPKELVDTDTRSESQNSIDDDIGNNGNNGVVKKPAAPKRTASQVTPNTSAQTAEVLTPKERRVAEKAFRTFVKKADMHLVTVIRAAASANQEDALRATVKVMDALEPIVRRQKGVSASVREFCSERLLHGRCDLKKMGDDRLRQLDKSLARFSFASANVVIEQLAYSTKAELLRRELRAVDMETAPLSKLDELHQLAEQLLAKAPKRQVLQTDNHILGTAFTPASLQAHVNTLARVIADEEAVEDLIDGPVNDFDAHAPQWTDAKLAELKKKITGLASQHPAAVAIEKAIEIDIDRRVLKARHNFEKVLRAAIRSDNAGETLDQLLQSAAKAHDAAALFKRLDNRLSQKDLAGWISITLGLEVKKNPKAPPRLQRLRDALNIGNSEVIRDALTTRNKVSRLKISARFLDTLKNCLNQMSLVTVVPTPSQSTLADTADSASEEMDIGWARAGLVQARQGHLNGTDRNQMMKLLFQISIIFNETKDIEELNGLRDMANAMTKAAIPFADIAADALEMSRLVDEEIEALKTA